MDFKMLALLLMLLIYVYEMVLHVVGYRSMYNPVPANVADIYDAEKYARWKDYHKDNYRFLMVQTTVSFVVNAALIALDVYALAVRSLPQSVYVQLLAVLGVSLLVDTVLGCIFSYVSNMVIEQKYGFNRTTMKTFVLDRVKETVVTILVECGLVLLFAWIHVSLGAWTPVLFAGVLAVLMLALIFLYPVLSKLFHKFVPLEDGELKERLTALLNKYGYKVKAIEVVQASERTTKSNAYFSGFGKLKTIVLYDNLISTMSTDEIVAVFAHEMGHGLHKDTLRNNGVNIGMFITLSVVLFISVSVPGLYADFGFDGVNYGFAFILMAMVLMPLIANVFSLIANKLSRDAEYGADRQAVEEGLGEQLISALKKLAGDNFSNLAPSKLLVLLNYSHPPIDARIDAIRKAQK